MAQIKRRASPKPAPPRRRVNKQLEAPRFRPVQLATLVDAVPTEPGWIHEIKYEGYRILMSVGGDQVRAYTRSGLDWSDKFGPIIKAAADLNAQSALLDGEAVVLDENGRSSFQLMQGAFRARAPRFVFYAFDLLYIDARTCGPCPCWSASGV